MKNCRVCLAAESRVKLTLLNLTPFYNMCNINVGSSKNGFTCQYCWKRIMQSMKLIATAQRTEYLLRNNSIGAGDTFAELHPYTTGNLANSATCQESGCLVNVVFCESPEHPKDEYNTSLMSVDTKKQQEDYYQLHVNNVFINDSVENSTRQSDESEKIDIKHNFIYDDIIEDTNSNIEVPRDLKQESEDLNILVEPVIFKPLTIGDANTSKPEATQRRASMLNGTETNKIITKVPEMINKQVEEVCDKIINKAEEQLISLNKNLNSDNMFVSKGLLIKNKTFNEMVATKSVINKNTNKLNEYREQFNFDISPGDVWHQSEEEKEKGLANKLEIVTLSFEQAKEEIEMLKKHDRYVYSKYKCDKCGKGFQSQGVYARHIDSNHNKDNKFECDICYYRFNTNNALGLHCSLYHINKWRCLLCKTIVRRNSWSTHKLKCWAQSIECALCHKNFKNNRTLQVHVKNIHTDRLFKCEVCDKSFTNSLVLSKHMSIHTDEKKFECSICKKKFRSHSNLKTHIGYVHRESGPKDKRYCAECNKYFKSAKILEIHLKYAKAHANPDIYRYECHDCGSLWNLKCKLLDHIQTVHLKKKEFSCSKCKQRYYSHRLLREHIRKAHEPQVRKHNCTTCGQAFSTPKYLRHHMVAVHCMQRPFVCDVCGATFGFNSALYIHKKLKHEGAKRCKGKFYYPNTRDAP